MAYKAVRPPPDSGSPDVADLLDGRRQFDRMKVGRVRCGRVLDYQTCKRVLVDAYFAPNSEGRLKFDFGGFPPGSSELLEELGIARAAASSNRSRRHLQTRNWLKESLKIQCNCGAVHVIRFDRVSEILIDKMIAGVSMQKPIDISTTEL